MINSIVLISKLLDRRQKIKLLSIFIWIFGLGLSFVKDYVFRQYLCLLVGSGPTNRDSKVSRHFILVFIIIQTLFIVAFNMRVLVELRRIQRRTHVCEHGGFTKRASVYIIAITIAYYTCLFPACVGLTLKSFGMQLWSLMAPAHVLQSLWYLQCCHIWLGNETISVTSQNNFFFSLEERFL